MSEKGSFATVESRVFALMARAGFTPATIFDIGASNGTWSCVISKVFPEAAFHLFEPLVDFLPSYREHLNWYLHEHPTFRLHEVALGAETKEITMSVDTTGFGSTTLNIDDVPGFRKVTGIKQYRLDEFVERFEVPLPDVIKLDTQGSERAILSRAALCLQNAGVVLAESWIEPGYGPETPLLPELRELLNSHEFALVGLGEHFYRPNHELYSCDTFFVKRRLLDRIAQKMPAGEW
jgi:FkbM family methyltransferase